MEIVAEENLPSVAADPSLPQRTARSLPERYSARVEEAHPSSSGILHFEDSFGPEGRFATASAHSQRWSCNCDEYAPLEEAEFETCRSDWSELRSASHDKQEEVIAESNRKAFRQFQQKWPNGFFQEVRFHLELGEKIAEGAQGEIYISQGDVWKVFRLEDASLFLETNVPLGLYQNYHGIGLGNYYCWVHGAKLLGDGRIAFKMSRYWGDLRRLIDLRMQDNNFTRPPFSYSTGCRLMWEIACGMKNLRERNIPHRDLKASNVLVMPSLAVGVARVNPCPRHSEEFACAVADYECSNGVLGTGLWRAPEILRAAKEGSISSKPELFSEGADVYSYAVTCYEILTGKFPFKGFGGIGHEEIYNGWVKLEWPGGIDPQIEALLEQCCHLQPSLRPTFKDICETFSDLFQSIPATNSSLRWSVPTLKSTLLTFMAAFPSLKAAFHTFQAALPNLQETLPRLHEKLTNLHETLIRFHLKLTHLQPALFQSELPNLESILADMELLLLYLESILPDIQAALSGLQSAPTDPDSTLSNLHAFIFGLQKSILGLELAFSGPDSVFLGPESALVGLEFILEFIDIRLAFPDLQEAFYGL